jgi:hypothetical protein
MCTALMLLPLPLVGQNLSHCRAAPAGMEVACYELLRGNRERAAKGVDAALRWATGRSKQAVGACKGAAGIQLHPLPGIQSQPAPSLSPTPHARAFIRRWASAPHAAAPWRHAALDLLQPLAEVREALGLLAPGSAAAGLAPGAAAAARGTPPPALAPQPALALSTAPPRGRKKGGGRPSSAPPQVLGDAAGANGAGDTGAAAAAAVSRLMAGWARRWPGVERVSYEPVRGGGAAAWARGLVTLPASQLPCGSGGAETVLVPASRWLA